MCFQYIRINIYIPYKFTFVIFTHQWILYQRFTFYSITCIMDQWIMAYENPELNLLKAIRFSNLYLTSTGTTVDLITLECVILNIKYNVKMLRNIWFIGAWIGHKQQAKPFKHFMIMENFKKTFVKCLKWFNRMNSSLLCTLIDGQMWICLFWNCHILKHWYLSLVNS